LNADADGLGYKVLYGMARDLSHKHRVILTLDTQLLSSTRECYVDCVSNKFHVVNKSEVCTYLYFVSLPRSNLFKLQVKAQLLPLWISLQVPKMSLAADLSEVYTEFHTNGPAQITKPIKESTADHAASFDFQKAIKAGDTLPPFKLSDAFGNDVASSTLLEKGPLLITFYRGEWCPFCNLALRALQNHLPQFEAKGVTLVAITCEVPKQALSTSEKNELKFPVLSDLGNKYAMELGLVFPMPEYMRPVFDGFGVDFKERNGDDSFVLPVPATLLVDQKGVVRNSFVEPEYHKRAEPETVLEWIDQL